MLIEDYKKGDIFKIELRDYERTLNDINPIYLERMESLAEHNSKVISENGKIITIVGLVELWKGVAEIWQIPSKHITDVKFEYCKTIRYLINTILKGDDYHRLQASCVDDDLHNRWLKFLDFEKEGTLRQYGPTKKDYAIYGRILNG